jgi:hypothetical protein
MSLSCALKAKRARRAAQNAISTGKLHRQPCEICGEVTPVDAHHEDYDKPLDVRWLCVRHHRQLHALRRPPQPRLTDTPLTHSGETLSITGWAVRHRMNPSTLYQRIVWMGWPIPLALNLRPASPRLVGHISRLVRAARQCLAELQKQQKAKKPVRMEMVQDAK